jgi:hypothetical protein
LARLKAILDWGICDLRLVIGDFGVGNLAFLAPWLSLDPVPVRAKAHHREHGEKEPALLRDLRAPVVRFFVPGDWRISEG